MDQILQRVCRIDNHPIKSLDIKNRLIYINGLGAALYTLSGDDKICRMFFSAWAGSILCNHVDVEEFWCENIDAIKTTVSVHFSRFQIFSMKYELLYDVIYLLSCSEPSKNLSITATSVYDYFKANICGFFSRKALKEITAYFKDTVSCNRISTSLIVHKKINDTFNDIRQKKVMVVANVSAGKSTLINALIGHRINKVRTTACTDKLVFIKNKPANDAATILNSRGEYEYVDPKLINSDYFSEIALPFQSTLSKHNVCIIDTPGINNAEDVKHRSITYNAIKLNDYDALIYVSNCQYNGTNDERAVLKFLKENVKVPILFVLNQLDRFKQKEDSVSKMMGYFKSDLISMGFNAPVILPISSKAAILHKLPDADLDEDDLYDKHSLAKRFERDYYDLPSYAGRKSTVNTIERSGIIELEKEILNIINK